MHCPCLSLAINCQNLLMARKSQELRIGMSRSLRVTSSFVGSFDELAISNLALRRPARPGVGRSPLRAVVGGQHLRGLDREGLVLGVVDLGQRLLRARVGGAARSLPDSQGWQPNPQSRPGKRSRRRAKFEYPCTRAG